MSNKYNKPILLGSCNTCFHKGVCKFRNDWTKATDLIQFISDNLIGLMTGEISATCKNYYCACLIKEVRQ